MQVSDEYFKLKSAEKNRGLFKLIAMHQNRDVSKNNTVKTEFLKSKIISGVQPMLM